MINEQWLTKDDKVSGSGLMLGTILSLHGGNEEDLKPLSKDNQPLGSDLN